jgi:hypothetical protein
MKAIWTPDHGNPVVLADDSLGRGVGSKSFGTGLPAFRQLLQEAQYPRGAVAEQFPRGNIVCDFRMLVLYEFSHPDECAMWLVSLASMLDTSGTLKLSGQRGSRSMAAVWSSIEPQRQVGVSADVLYHFRGGIFE